MNYQEKINAHYEQMQKDGYSAYSCGHCAKKIWRKPIENWFFCEDCTLKMEQDDKLNGVA